MTEKRNITLSFNKVLGMDKLGSDPVERRKKLKALVKKLRENPDGKIFKD